MGKLAKMSAFVPGLYQPTFNPNVKSLLFAWSSEDDELVRQVENAKEQLFVKYAGQQYLDALGSNVGVFRPSSINLTDDQYRELIPTLSFRPKQVIPTIKKVLGVFYGANNPTVNVHEINGNEIVIEIPSSVPALRRTLKGSHHFHSYSGEITAVDNVAKTMVVNIGGSTQDLAVDELSGAKLGVGYNSTPILSNTSGNTGVILQFSASFSLAAYSPGDRFVIAENEKYPGSFVPDTRRPYTVTKQRARLAQNVVAGDIYTSLLMEDASGIPNAFGRLIFNFGVEKQEADIRYFGRPNNTTLLIDPSYIFLKNHSIGDVVNVIVKPYGKPAVSGADYSVYLVGVEAARILAQRIVESITAAGVLVRWIIREPVC